MSYSPGELAAALGLHAPTDEQAAIIAAPPGPMVVIAGAGAGKTETMAARVVWLVANGYATGDQVLGLTFTRKAAGQLLRRTRSRLARLAGSGLALPTTSSSDNAAGSGLPTVSTYHAFAGTLLTEFGLLLPVEPDTRLLGETECWQLAYDVVTSYPGDLATERNPAAVTELVLRLSGQLAEHLVSIEQLQDTHLELEQLVHTLPAGPSQRQQPNQTLLKMLRTQTDRAELVPLIEAFHDRLRSEKAMDFGMQMAAAAQLAQRFPQVGALLRQRFPVVLLDEYQDTGHAQRVALSALFGPTDSSAGPALTAVGDPIQSIYGWRGASATNLPRFTTDFPNADGRPAGTLDLCTSWRNPPSTLRLANAVSEPARRSSVAVRELCARPDAPAGTVQLALLADVATERDWVADHIARRYQVAQADGTAPPTAAVLVRRNADAVPVAQALRARGVPVEVAGVAGLLEIDEVADLVAMLQLVTDPTAGPAAMRVLTGARWRLGARDIAVLWQRARHLGDHGGRIAGSVEDVVAQLDSDSDVACLADAINDPGMADRYSEVGYQRLCALADELTRLRGQLDRPVPELVAEVRRLMGLDLQVRSAVPPGAAWTGVEQLDAFADVVDAYCARLSSAERLSGNAIHGLLAYLQVAGQVEGGLAPAEVTVAEDRVQVLTVHAAKGLEWQVVAVPHLSERVFPAAGKTATWLTDPGDLPPVLRGDRARLDEHGVPVLDLSAVTHRKQLSDAIDAHRQLLNNRRIDEERRLLYVAITRAEDTLLLSGHHWGATGATPRGPSEFLTELKAEIERAAAEGQPCGDVEQWAPAPEVGASNPLCESAVEAVWPADPLGERRAAVERGAALVATAIDTATQRSADTEPDPYGWAADVDVLLAEHAARNAPADAPSVQLPGQLSVSTLVELHRDPAAVAARLRRRVPVRPDPHALLGTAFHDWVQRYYGADRLFDLDDLPGAVDGSRAESPDLDDLQTAFMASPWAARTPIDVEVPFEMVLGERVVRGRIDAVFADNDAAGENKYVVVDWKTGSPPSDDEGRRHAAVQLAVYAQAWAGLRGCAPEQVRAAFHYVRTGVTAEPETLPGAAELAAIAAQPE